MKTTLAAASLTLLLTVSAFAEPVTIKTITGKTYAGEITSRAPDGINIMTDDGVTKLLFTELPPEVQKQFGYDPSKVAAYQQAVAFAQSARIRAETALQPVRPAESEPTLDPQTDARLSAEAKRIAAEQREKLRKGAIQTQQQWSMFHNGLNPSANTTPSVEKLEADIKAKLIDAWRKDQLKQQGKL